MARPAKNPEEFRREAVALVRSSERPVAVVARSLGIAEGTLWNWVRADRDAEARDAEPDAFERVGACRVESGCGSSRIVIGSCAMIAVLTAIPARVGTNRSIAPTLERAVVS